MDDEISNTLLLIGNKSQCVSHHLLKPSNRQNTSKESTLKDSQESFRDEIYLRLDLTSSSSIKHLWIQSSLTLLLKISLHPCTYSHSRVKMGTFCITLETISARFFSSRLPAIN
jgi:hypothetical protein